VRDITGGGARRVRRPRVRLTAALVAVLQLTTGCFTYVPPRTAPDPGAPLQVELSDPGRVAHSATLGPGILRLAGTLRGMDGERYRVEVASVTPIRGPELPVSGIQVTLAPADISDLRVRTLSRTRTAWVIGTAVAAVVAFLVTEGFRAGSTPPEGPPGGGGPDQWRGSATVTCCN
jgi:hypothetical protein